MIIESGQEPTEHIFPRSASDLSRGFPLGELVPLGDPGPGHAVFQVGEPYGRDMIVVIAAAQPVFRTPRPHTGEQSLTYGRDLRTAVEQARGRSVRLSAAVIQLDTVAR